MSQKALHWSRFGHPLHAGEFLCFYHGKHGHPSVTQCYNHSLCLIQVHKETIDGVPNAIPGRIDIELEIYGMEGIPEKDMQERRRTLEQKSQGKRKDQIIFAYILYIGLKGAFKSFSWKYDWGGFKMAWEEMYVYQPTCCWLVWTIGQ